MNQRRPIGVFDSGVGGLTVLRALREQLPAESLLYLGDTARLPYGTKSAGTVVRYAEQAAEIEKHRATLQAKLANHKRMRAADPANWGYVGDLGYILEQVKNAADFLEIC